MNECDKKMFERKWEEFCVTEKRSSERNKQLLQLVAQFTQINAEMAVETERLRREKDEILRNMRAVRHHHQSHNVPKYAIKARKMTSHSVRHLVPTFRPKMTDWNQLLPRDGPIIGIPGTKKSPKSPCKSVAKTPEQINHLKPPIHPNTVIPRLRIEEEYPAKDELTPEFMLEVVKPMGESAVGELENSSGDSESGELSVKLPEQPEIAPTSVCEPVDTVNQASVQDSEDETVSKNHEKLIIDVDEESAPTCTVTDNVGTCSPETKVQPEVIFGANTGETDADSSETRDVDAHEIVDDATREEDKPSENSAVNLGTEERELEPRPVVTQAAILSFLPMDDDDDDEDDDSFFEMTKPTAIFTPKTICKAEVVEIKIGSAQQDYNESSDETEDILNPVGNNSKLAQDNQHVEINEGQLTKALREEEARRPSLPKDSQPPTTTPQLANKLAMYLGKEESTCHKTHKKEQTQDDFDFFD